MKEKGFNLVELMVVILLVGIVAGFGLPSLTYLIDNNNLVATTNSVKSSLQLARAEAISRGMVVNAGRTGSTSQDWTDGWLVYATNTTTSGGSAYNSSADTLLLDRSEGASGSTIIKVNSAANSYISFNPDGTLNEGSAVVIALCDDRGESGGRQIDIALTGRISLSSPTADCTP